ncbi:hypothetical protein BLOT_008181 [Blomia tropicalis]|nr:hypothetical protein BLOT_008181 [Blomia tropicalis]
MTMINKINELYNSITFELKIKFNVNLSLDIFSYHWNGSKQIAIALKGNLLNDKTSGRINDKHRKRQLSLFV